MIQQGDAAVLQKGIGLDEVQDYLRLTGDPNPLFCQSNGKDRRRVPPPLIMGLISNLLGTKLPGRGTNWLKQSMKFAAYAYAGDPLETRIEVSSIKPEKHLVKLHSECRDSSGTLICEADSLVLIKDLE